MALNFGLLGDAGAPAMGYIQGQQDVARNQLAQQQVETGRMTQDKMRMEMDSMRRRQAGLDQFMQKAKELGVDGDPEQLARAFYDQAIATSDPQQIQAATIAVQAARERKAYMGGQPGAGGAVSTPVPMTNNLGTALPPAGAPPMPFSAGAAPAAAPSQGNALAGNRLSQIENRLVELRQFPTAGAQERADLIKERDRLMTPYVLAPGSSLATLGGGVGVASAEKPGGESPLAKLQREMAALPPGDPRIPQYVAAINKEITRAPGTNITMVSERAEQGARGKMLVDQYGDISKAAGLAARTLPSIEANLSALNKGFDTGFGKETVAAGASVLAALGVKDAEKFATDSQMFQSNAINAVLQKQLEQKGPQTESDAKRIEQIGAQLGKTKDANEFILATAKEQLKRDIDQRNFYDRWYKTNKTYDGAEDSWFTGEGGKSLFDRPALKRYAAAPPPSSASLIPGSTPAAAVAPQGAIDALKAGKGTDAQFDAIFGAGAAKRAKGGK